MARIRTIKPSFWSDEAVAELSRDARLLLIGLISFADDEGRFLASPSAIVGYVYPNDDIPAARLRRWLVEIEAAGIVQFYNGGKLAYGAFHKWEKHQRISHPQESTFPPPVTDAV